MKISTLAASVASTRAHISKIEAGRRVPNALLLHELACALEVPVEALYACECPKTHCAAAANVHELPDDNATTTDDGATSEDRNQTEMTSRPDRIRFVYAGHPISHA